MKNNVTLIIPFLFLASIRINAQSVEINPLNTEALINAKGGFSQMEQLSKIGNARFKIEGKSIEELDNYRDGSAQIELSGNPSHNPSNGSTSFNGLVFKHGNTQRWSFGDNYQDLILVDNYIYDDAFFIKESNGQTPFLIVKGSNQVDISKLRINSTDTFPFKGFLIEGGTDKSMVLNNQLSSPMFFQSNGSTKLTLLPTGNFGVGITDPQRKLDVSGTARVSSTMEVGGNTTLSQNLSVNGTLNLGGDANVSQNLAVVGNVQIGGNGSYLTEIIKTSYTINLPTINAVKSTTLTIPVAKAYLGSTVTVSPSGALPDGIVIAYARVPANDTVEIKFTNATTGDVNPAVNTFFITIIR